MTGNNHLRHFVAALIGLLLAFAPPQASACLGAFAQRYVFQSMKPAHIPIGLTAIEVDVPKISSEGGEIALPLAAAVNGLPAGTTVRIEPGRWTDCSNWGAEDQPAFAVGLFVETKDGPVFAVIQLRTVRNFRLDPAQRAALMTGMTNFGYSELVARAAIMIAEANLDDYDDSSNFFGNVERQADLLDPLVKVRKGK